MADKSFEEKLKEREAAIRQKWEAQSKAKKVTATTNSPGADDSPNTVKREMEHELSLLKMMAKEQIPTGVRNMTEADYAGLLERVKEAFARHGIPSENIWLQLNGPEMWAVSLFLPYKGLAIKRVNSTVQKILADDIGVDVSCTDYFGKNPKFQAHEWYFMPPEIPKDIKRCIDVAGEFSLQTDANTELGLGIPVPNKARNTGRVPVLALPEELYRKIESGEKTVEYRNLVSYYCDLFFDTGKMEKAVKFQLGYSGKDGGKPERMAWEIKDIMLVSEHGKLAPAMTNGKMSTFKNLPRPFAPVAYAIKLGKRLDISHLPDDKLQFETVEAISVSTDESRALVDGIKAGRLKSKSPDGYLVLKAEFYDAIETGTKKVEYRDFTEYNLKRTIGIKTIRFNRGYVKNAPQMRWEVEKIVLLDGEDNGCDPFNVPEDFWPVTIAIHLGKRIDFNGEQAMTRKETANSKNGGNGLTRKSLSFYKKRTCWYAEVPEHTEAQNQMVSGADVMCETMACGHKRVTIDFLYGEDCKPSSVKCLACLDKIGQTAYGAIYRLSSESSTVHLPDTAWLCNVTKTVCDGHHPTHIYITDVRPNDEPPYGRATRRSGCKRVRLPWEGRTDLIMSNDEYWRELHKACPPSKEEREEKPLDDMTEEELEEAANRYFGRINSKEADKVFERRQLGALKAEYEWEQNGCKGERPENIGSIIAASYNPFWSDAH